MPCPPSLPPTDDHELLNDFAGALGQPRSRMSPRGSVSSTALSHFRLCRTFGGDGPWRQPSRIRWRRRAKPARPYICLLIILVLVLTPSVRPLWYGRVTAAVAAWRSSSRPRVKACRWGRSAARAAVIHAEPAVVARVWGQQGRELADEAGQGGHLGAGCGECRPAFLLAVGEAVGPGEQEPGGAAG